MSDVKRHPLRFWLSTVVVVICWGAMHFERNTPLASAGATVICCLSVAGAFQVARRRRSL